MLFFRKYITAETKAIIEKFYPCVLNDLALRNFVMHLLFGPYEKQWHDSDESLKLILSHYDIAAMTNQDIKNTHWKSGDFIKKIKSIPELSHLEIEEYTPMLNCRMIKDHILPDELQKALSKERSKRQKETVHYATGLKFTKQKASDLKKEKQKHIEAWSQSIGITDDQKLVLNYLNNLDERVFNYRVDLNYVNASNAIYEYFKDDTTKRNKYIRMLADIRQDSKPLYYTVAGSHRLFNRGCITSLIRSARKALCKGWIDFDLSSAYLSILTKLLKLQEADKVLDVGVWNYLKTQNVNKTDSVKQALYSLCFGKSLKKIKIENINDQNVLKLIELPFIIEMKEKCNLKLKEIMEQYKCSHKIARGSLAKLVSKIELKLLKPIFELAMEKKYFDVVLYQYDGVTISVAEDKKSHVINLLTKTINAKIKELGYKTELVHEIL